MLNDLVTHSFVSYIEDLIYDEKLRFLEEFVSGLPTVFRSSTIIAQMNALKAGVGIGVIPYFMVIKVIDQPPPISLIDAHR